EEQQIAGTEGDLRFLISLSRVQRDRHARRRQRLDSAIRAQQELRVVAGVHVLQPSSLYVENRQKQRDVHAAWRVRVDLPIETVGKTREIGFEPETRTERRLNVCHQQRGAHPLTRDITDQQGHSAVGQREVVEEVAPDLTRWYRNPLDLGRSKP